MFLPPVQQSRSLRFANPHHGRKTTNSQFIVRGVALGALIFVALLFIVNPGRSSSSGVNISGGFGEGAATTVDDRSKKIAAAVQRVQQLTGAGANACGIPDGTWRNTCEPGASVLEGPCQVTPGEPAVCLVRAACKNMEGETIQSTIEFSPGVPLKLQNTNGVLCDADDASRCGQTHHYSLCSTSRPIPHPSPPPPQTNQQLNIDDDYNDLPFDKHEKKYDRHERGRRDDDYPRRRDRFDDDNDFDRERDGDRDPDFHHRRHEDTRDKRSRKSWRFRGGDDDEAA